MTTNQTPKLPVVAALAEQLEHYERALEKIAAFAHAHSSVHSFTDDMWNVHAMAYDASDASDDSSQLIAQAEVLLADLDARIAELEAALKANHEWHQLHDDYDGYAESELAMQNIAALAQQAQEPKP